MLDIPPPTPSTHGGRSEAAAVPSSLFWSQNIFISQKQKQKMPLKLGRWARFPPRNSRRVASSEEFQRNCFCFLKNNPFFFCFILVFLPRESESSHHVTRLSLKVRAARWDNNSRSKPSRQSRQAAAPASSASQQP